MNYWIIFIVLIAILYLLRRYFPQIKGAIGENRIKKHLNKLPEEYKTLHDVMLRKQGRSSQIDHVVVSPYGVFVIETKNYTGWMFGDEKSEYWMQTIYKSRKRFRNPIKQNWSHVYMLNELLDGYDKDIFIPIVVFAGDCELKKVQATSKVVYDENLYKTIMSYSEHRLTTKEVEEIYHTISTNLVDEKGAKKQHVKDIKTGIKEREIKERMHVCPKCNGQLIEKQGKYGNFQGCSNYPKCRYTRAV